MSTATAARPPSSWLRIGGVPVVTPWSSLLGLLLVAWLFAPNFSGASRGTSGALVIAVVFAVLLYASILLHELAHAAAARHFGFDVHRIELHMLGGYTTYERGRSTPGRELTIALVGPFTTLAVAAASYVAARVVAATWPGQSVAHLLLAQLTAASLFIGVFNLLPGLPLDGGALVKCPVWSVTGSEPRGTRAGAYAGFVVAVVVFALPFLLGLLAGDARAPDLGAVVLGAAFAAWLGLGAVAALRRARIDLAVDGLDGGALARPFVTVTADVSVSEARTLVSGAPGCRLLVTDPAGRPLAAVQDAALAAVPAERAPWVTVGAVARSLECPLPVASSLVGYDLLHTLASHPATDHLVTDDAGQVVGLLADDDIERALSG